MLHKSKIVSEDSEYAFTILFLKLLIKCVINY